MITTSEHNRLICKSAQRDKRLKGHCLNAASGSKKRIPALKENNLTNNEFIR